MKAHSSSSFWQRPATQWGRYAAVLASIFVLMFIVNSTVFMPISVSAPEAWWRRTLLILFGIFMILCGLTAGVMGLIAVVRKHERSCIVFATILPGVWLLIFLLGEFLFPH